MSAARYASASAARAALGDVERALSERTDIVSRSAFSIGDARCIKHSGTNIAGLAWTSGVWVFTAEAPSEERLSALIGTSRAGGLGMERERALLRLFPLLLVAFAAAASAAIVPVMRLSLRAVAVAAAPGLAAVSGADMRARLLALNRPSRPYVVRQEPSGQLVAEWNIADATWWGLLAKSGLREIYRLRLALDEARHRVLALDEAGAVGWAAGLAAAPSVRYRARMFRGVVLFRYQRGVVYGWRRPLGPPAKILDYKFDVRDLKGPAIEAVTTGGWRFEPVLWRRDLKV